MDEIDSLQEPSANCLILKFGTDDSFRHESMSVCKFNVPLTLYYLLKTSQIINYNFITCEKC